MKLKNKKRAAFFILFILIVVYGLKYNQLFNKESMYVDKEDIAVEIVGTELLDKYTHQVVLKISNHNMYALKRNHVAISGENQSTNLTYTSNGNHTEASVTVEREGKNVTASTFKVIKGQFDPLLPGESAEVVIEANQDEDSLVTIFRSHEIVDLKEAESYLYPTVIYQNF